MKMFNSLMNKVLLLVAILASGGLLMTCGGGGSSDSAADGDLYYSDKTPKAHFVDGYPQLVEGSVLTTSARFKVCVDMDVTLVYVIMPKEYDPDVAANEEYAAYYGRVSVNKDQDAFIKAYRLKPDTEYVAYFRAGERKDSVTRPVAFKTIPIDVTPPKWLSVPTIEGKKGSDGFGSIIIKNVAVDEDADLVAEIYRYRSGELYSDGVMGGNLVAVESGIKLEKGVVLPEIEIKGSAGCPTICQGYEYFAVLKASDRSSNFNVQKSIPLKSESDYNTAWPLYNEDKAKGVASIIVGPKAKIGDIVSAPVNCFSFESASPSAPTKTSFNVDAKVAINKQYSQVQTDYIICYVTSIRNFAKCCYIPVSGSKSADIVQPKSLKIDGLSMNREYKVNLRFANDVNPTAASTKSFAVTTASDDLILVEKGSFEMGGYWGDNTFWPCVPDKEAALKGDFLTHGDNLAGIHPNWSDTGNSGWWFKYAMDSRHQASLTYSYYIGRYEVTESEYKLVMEDDSGSESRYPVTSVTWLQATQYCNKLSELYGFKPAYNEEGELLDPDGGKDITKIEGYRLPTEVEWEYAARNRGTTSAMTVAGDKNDRMPVSKSTHIAFVGWVNFTNFEDRGNRDKYAVTADSKKTTPEKVGTLLPNELNIFDMSGNVWEWCEDYYERTYGWDIVGSGWNDQNIIFKNNSSMYRRDGKDYIQLSDKGYGHVIRGGAYDSGFRFKKWDGKCAHGGGYACAGNSFTMHKAETGYRAYRGGKHDVDLEFEGVCGENTIDTLDKANPLKNVGFRIVRTQVVQKN